MEAAKSDVYNLQLKVPSTTCIYAQSKGGKTQLAIKIINNLKQVFDKPIHKIIYLYSIWQEAYNSIKPSTIFLTELDDVDAHIEEGLNHLLVLDDQLLRAVKRPQDIEQYFIQVAHHKSVCVIYCAQSPFVKQGSLIALNSDYICMYSFPRNMQLVKRWFMQVDDSLANQLYQQYKEIVSSGPYKYLFISFHPSESPETRFRNSVFANEDTIIYKPRHHGKNNARI